MMKIVTAAIIVLVLLTLTFVVFNVYRTQQNTKTIVTPTPRSTTVIPTPTISEKNIMITSPEAGTDVRLPLKVSGKARVFENQFNYRVVSRDTVVKEGQVSAQAKDTGEYGDFTIKITALPSSVSGQITVQLFDYSAKDGSMIDLVELPLVLNR